jgi:spectinomycin phosphotransferase
MLEKQSLSDELIINHLKTDYGIEVSTLTFLPIGADMNASVYRAQSFDQKSYFIKLKLGHHHDIGVVVMELLHNSRVPLIIPPIKTLKGQLIQRIEGFTLIAFPFVKGQDGFSCHLTDDQWIKLGHAMRQVHELHVPLSLQNKLRKEIYSPKWRDGVRSLYVHIEGTLTGDEVALKLLKFMKMNLSTIRRLVDRAEQLGQKLQDQSPKFVLCHTDIHGGNVLIDERNDAIYIVDWDEPMMAPKERDLMFIGGGVGNVWNKLHEDKSFYKGYGKTEIDLTILAYYRHERIIEDIAIYGNELLLTTAGGENRLEMYKQFVGMFEPHGVVDIAFKTDWTME